MSLCNLFRPAEFLKINKEYIAKHSKKSQNSNKQVKIPQNFHWHIILWLHIYQKVPHRKNSILRKINVIKTPFFVVIQNFAIKLEVVLKWK